MYLFIWDPLDPLINWGAGHPELSKQLEPQADAVHATPESGLDDLEFGARYMEFPTIRCSV